MPSSSSTGATLFPIGPRSSADRAAAFEAACGGSIPPGATTNSPLDRRARRLVGSPGDGSGRMGRARRVVAGHRRAARRVARPWPTRLIGLVLAFGAGALISAVSFDLAQEGAQVGDPESLGRASRSARSRTSLLNRLVGRRGRGGRRGERRATPAPHSRSARSSTASPSRPCSASGSPGRGGQRRPARRDLRVQPAGSDRLVHRDACGRDAPGAIRRSGCWSRYLRRGDGRRLRHRRQRLGQPQRRRSTGSPPARSS